MQGCDGSVLLEDQDGIVSELGAPGNGGITGFNIVNDIKTAVENVCPGIVSCADILALSSRDAVTLVFSYSKLNIKFIYYKQIKYKTNTIINWLKEHKLINHIMCMVCWIIL